MNGVGGALDPALLDAEIRSVIREIRAQIAYLDGLGAHGEARALRKEMLSSMVGGRA